MGRPQHSTRIARELGRQVVEFIRRHEMFGAGSKVGVAVSGGADSVALVLLLDGLAERLGIRPLVVHVHHQMRGPEADADEEFVARLATESGLEFVSVRKDTLAHARRHGWNLEDAARRLRYEFFNQLVRAGRADRVAVAHTADDQAETVLAQLMRGSGLTGLGAIHPVNGSTVRPLLEIRRQVLRDFLTDSGQPWREDATNRDTTRLRSRIRHQLLPVLEADFQPRIVAHLGRLATLAREEEQYWTALALRRLDGLIKRTRDGCSVSVRKLLSPFEAETEESVLPAAVCLASARRLVRAILGHLQGDLRHLTARHLDQVVHLARSSSSGRSIYLPGGMTVERCFDQLLFRLARPRASSAAFGVEAGRKAYEYHVHLNGPRSTISVPEIGRRFQLKVIDWPPAGSETTQQGPAVDLARLRSPLIIRNWRSGDAYRPLGRRHVRKLRRLLLEGRVPCSERSAWPVLTSEGALVWARDLPVAAEFAPRAETKSGLVIVEEAIES